MCGTNNNNNNDDSCSKKDDNGNPDDKRPFVKDLLEKHATTIEDTRRRIVSALEEEEEDDSDDGKEEGGWDPLRYDDIWILRYVLSHKGSSKAAAKAAVKTIRYRDEMKWNDASNDDLHLRLKSNGVEKNQANDDAMMMESLPYFDLQQRFIGKNGCVFSQPDPDRGVLMYVDFSAYDLEGMNDNMSDDVLKTLVSTQNEAVFRIVDEVTRRTGRLTKITKIIDMSDLDYSGLHFGFLRRDADCATWMEDFHPQLTDTVYFVNPPSFITYFWKFVKAFLPKRVVEKVDIVSTTTTKKKKKSGSNKNKNNSKKNPFRRHVTEENLPVHLGGKNPVWPVPSVAETLMAATATASSGASGASC